MEKRSSHVYETLDVPFKPLETFKKAVNKIVYFQPFKFADELYHYVSLFAVL